MGKIWRRHTSLRERLNVIDNVVTNRAPPNVQPGELIGIEKLLAALASCLHKLLSIHFGQRLASTRFIKGCTTGKHCGYDDDTQQQLHRHNQIAMALVAAANTQLQCGTGRSAAARCCSSSCC